MDIIISLHPIMLRAERILKLVPRCWVQLLIHPLVGVAVAVIVVMIIIMKVEGGVEVLEIHLAMCMVEVKKMMHRWLL